MLWYRPLEGCEGNANWSIKRKLGASPPHWQGCPDPGEGPQGQSAETLEPHVHSGLEVFQELGGHQSILYPAQKGANWTQPTLRVCFRMRRERLVMLQPVATCPLMGQCLWKSNLGEDTLENDLSVVGPSGTPLRAKGCTRMKVAGRYLVEGP